MEMLEKGEIAPEYDAIIIDEGQDFSEDWLSTAKYFMKPMASSMFSLTLCRTYTRIVQGSLRWRNFYSLLDENCRNTKKIAQASEIIELEINSMPGMPEERMLPLLNTGAIQSSRQNTQKIRELIGIGIRPNQILILLEYTMKDPALLRQKRLTGMRFRSLAA